MPRSNSNRPPERRIRVRSKRLAEIDSTKLALAVWLMAQNIVEDRTSTPSSEPSPAVAPPSTDADANAETS